jgi:hypothetical protein
VQDRVNELGHRLDGVAVCRLRHARPSWVLVGLLPVVYLAKGFS